MRQDIFYGIWILYVKRLPGIDEEVIHITVCGPLFPSVFTVRDTHAARFTDTSGFFFRQRGKDQSIVCTTLNVWKGALIV